MEAHGDRIKDFQLIPSKGGCFELKVDGRVVFSKLKSGLFPNAEDMVEELGKLPV